MRLAAAAIGVFVCLQNAPAVRSADLDFDAAISDFLRDSNAKLRAQAELHLRRLAGQARDRLVGPNFDPKQTMSRALASTSKQVRVWRNADVRVAANGDVSLVRRNTMRSPSRRETEQEAQARGPASLDRDRHRLTRNADHFLAQRLAQIDEMRDRALIDGDVQILLRAVALESEARAAHRTRFALDNDNEERSVR